MDHDSAYQAARDLLKELTLEAKLAGVAILEGRHRRLTHDMAQELFEFTPSLLGRNLDAIVLTLVPGGVCCTLSIVDLPYCPSFVMLPPVPGANARGVALDLLSLAWSIIHKNRAEGNEQQLVVYRINEQRFTFTAAQIDAMAEQVAKIPKSEMSLEVMEERVRNSFRRYLRRGAASHARMALGDDIKTMLYCGGGYSLDA